MPIGQKYASQGNSVIVGLPCTASLGYKLCACMCTHCICVWSLLAKTQLCRAHLAHSCVVYIAIYIPYLHGSLSAILAMTIFS